MGENRNIDVDVRTDAIPTTAMYMLKGIQSIFDDVSNTKELADYHKQYIVDALMSTVCRCNKPAKSTADPKK